MKSGYSRYRAEAVSELFETPHDHPPEHVFVITAYLDESEHADSSKYTVIAGFRGKKAHWDSFIPAWKQGLGKRPHLHMTELRWNDEKAESRIKPLLERLGPIPYRCGLIPVYATVRTEDYFDLVRNNPVLRPFGGYLLSIAHVFTLLLTTVPAYERIKIVCEQQDRYEWQVRGLFKAFGQSAEKAGYARLQSIEFEKKGTCLTEPADYLAFAISKEFSEQGSKKELWCRPIKEPPGWTAPCKTGMWLPREVARETMTQILEENRAILSK